jgi:hypothetical protein
MCRTKGRRGGGGKTSDDIVSNEYKKGEIQWKTEI